MKNMVNRIRIHVRLGGEHGHHPIEEYIFHELKIYMYHGVLYFRRIFLLDRNERFGEFLKATCRTMEMDQDKVFFMHSCFTVDAYDTPNGSRMKMDAIITVWEINQKSDDEQKGKYFISLPLFHSIRMYTSLGDDPSVRYRWKEPEQQSGE